MLRGTIFLLLFIFFAGLIFAQEGNVVANIEKDLRYKMIEKAARPEIIEKNEYYEIRGNDEKELRSQMTRNGTKWDDGKTYDSVTSWNVRWDYDYNQTADGCLADGFKTTVNIVIRYPRWMRTDEASEHLVRKWDTYMKNLIEHENGHRDMAIEAAAEISHAVAQLPPVASCSELDRKVEELSRERMAQLRVASREYDTTTVHGRTQGAVFP